MVPRVGLVWGSSGVLVERRGRKWRFCGDGANHENAVQKKVASFQLVPEVVEARSPDLVPTLQRMSETFVQFRLHMAKESGREGKLVLHLGE